MAAIERSDAIDEDRRRLLRTATAGIVAAGAAGLLLLPRRLAAAAIGIALAHAVTDPADIDWQPTPGMK